MNKGPWRITFDTNPEICNLNCIMCEEHSAFSNKSREKGVMPFELIERIVEEAVNNGLKEIIPSTMGEPLLYKDFEKIINLCNHFDIKMNLTTNGTFPGKNVFEWAKLLIPVCSDIKISWNGSTKYLQESIMVGSNFEEMNDKVNVLLNVRDEYYKQKKKYCSITLQTTFMENNAGDLTNLAEKCINWGIDRLKGHHLWVHFPEIKNLSMTKDKESIRKWNNIVKDLYTLVEVKRLPIGKRLKLDNIFKLEEENINVVAENGTCPFLGREAWINWEGRFDPCCAPDNLRKSLGNFGNTKNSSFFDIWNSNKYIELINNYQNYKLCKSCKMKKELE